YFIESIEDPLTYDPQLNGTGGFSRLFFAAGTARVGKSIISSRPFKNISSKLFSGVGNLFARIGARLSGSSATAAQIAERQRLGVITGQLFERTLNTSKGPVDILAEIVVEGDKITLKDIAIFGRGKEALTGLTREVLAARTQLAAEAKSLGFTELKITGKRVLTSTSANPGKAVEVTIDLTK
ncbi:MAG: hypothetical protein JNM06_04650, partial [Blastocatellia bacterium]|nr:hypothetical protein [Blastocatellia bacterium]